MKKIIFATIAVILFITISCNKNRNEKLYTGSIVAIQEGCYIAPAQYPYVIKFDDVTELEENHPIRIISGLDSSCSALIPDEYKIIGKKIKFGFRKINADEEFTCDTYSNPYYQVIITKISNNQ